MAMPAIFESTGGRSSAGLKQAPSQGMSAGSIDHSAVMV